MSVINEFKVKSIRYLLDPKEVHMTDEQGNRSVFTFDIYCRARPMATEFHLFFDMHSKKLLITYRRPVWEEKEEKFECGVMRFWITNDAPIPSCSWIKNQDHILRFIDDQFKEQLAAFTINQIINSSKSKSV